MNALIPVKLALYGLNLLLWCCGLAIFSVGVWIRSDQDFWEYQDNLEIGQYYSACYLIIIVGALLLILGFLGCVGTYSDSSCIIIGLAATLFIMMIMNISAAGLSWKIAQGNSLQEQIRTWLSEKIDMTTYDAKARRFMDLLQIHLQCCGATSKHDYEIRDITIPQSCSSVRTNNVFIYGCSENLRILLERTGALVGGMSLFVALIQLMSIIVCVVFLISLRESYRGNNMSPERRYLGPDQDPYHAETKRSRAYF